MESEQNLIVDVVLEINYFLKKNDLKLESC